jgi:RalA-binding protein 1
MQKSLDTEAIEEAIDFTLQTAEPSKTPEIPETIPEATNTEDLDKVYVTEGGFLTLHKDHSEYSNLIRLQLENQELQTWKQQLQARINVERAECVRLKKSLPTVENTPEIPTNFNVDDPELEKIIEHYQKENALLEQKRILLAKEILEENISLIQLQVDLAMKQFVH